MGASPDLPPTLLLSAKGTGFACTFPADLPGRFERYRPPSAVPGAHPLVSGVVELRGRVVTVIDLAGCVGAPRETVAASGPPERGLLLVLAPPLAHLAFVVPEDVTIEPASRREGTPHVDAARLRSLIGSTPTVVAVGG